MPEAKGAIIIDEPVGIKPSAWLDDQGNRVLSMAR
jgi:hypothetical protein